MSETWYEHSIACTTHGRVNFITKTETLLTACPYDAGHTVVANSAYIVGTLSQNQTRILQESSGSKTNAKYACFGKSFIAAGNPTGATGGTVTNNHFRFDMPFTVFTGLFNARSGMDGDIFDLRIIPQTPITIGILGANAHHGDTSLTVSSSTFNMLESGYARIYLKTAITGGYRYSEKVEVLSTDTNTNTVILKTPLEIEDGEDMLAASVVQVVLLSNIVGQMTTSNTLTSKWLTVASAAFSELIPGRWVNIFRTSTNKSILSMIEKVDTATNRIRIYEPFDVAMDVADGPVYLQLTTKTVHNVVLQDNSVFKLGTSIIGGSYIPDGVAIVVDYTRNSPGDIRVNYAFEMFV